MAKRLDEGPFVVDPFVARRFGQPFGAGERFGPEPPLCALRAAQAGGSVQPPRSWSPPSGTKPERQARSPADPSQRATTSRARASNRPGETRWDQLQEAARSSARHRPAIVLRKSS
ncbi:hypothetical protein AB0K16_24700 [Nonomuraea jabiensis]|uniref:hypothetical protein n=1 Tax=Nonomuraea jabiensis TaxID=882448 RepID=UPI003438B1B9